MKNLEKLNLQELTKEENKNINGGDGITEAVFWFFGRFIHEQKRDATKFGGPTATQS